MGIESTNSRSSLLRFSIVIPDLESNSIIMSARVYFMKKVNGCKDVSVMSLQDEQWKRASLLYMSTYNVLVLLGTTVMKSKNKQTNFKHSGRISYGLQLSQ